MINLPTLSPDAGERELRRYLFRLAFQLQNALDGLESGQIAQGKTLQATEKRVEAGESPEQSFQKIKSLIIRSADIVEAYSEELYHRLAGDYLAVSDFGTYREETEATLEATSREIAQHYDNIQTLESDYAGLQKTVLAVQASIKTGLLYYEGDGTPVYGMEIGQRETVDGVEAFHKFARFTADRLSFYDTGGNEVAYISDYRLHITHARVTGSLSLGKYRVDASDGLVCKWIDSGQA